MTNNRILIITGMLMFLCNTLTAQKRKIAIVSRVDSVLYHTHVGTTMFSNKKDTIKSDFNCLNYIDNKLYDVLSDRYDLEFIELPESALPHGKSLYGFYGLRKSFKNWLSAQKSKYNFVIYICDGHADFKYSNQKLKGSGLYTRGNPIRSWAAGYSTVNFNVYRTSNCKRLRYLDFKSNYLKIIKKYRLKKRKELFPEITPLFMDNMIQVIDDKIDYFVKSTHLIPRKFK